MKIHAITVGALVAALLAGCSDDDDDSPVLPPNQTPNQPGVIGDEECAGYQVDGEERHGVLDDSNCVYDESFVSDENPLTTDLTISALDDDGVHIFEDSLWVGEDVDQNAADQGTEVPQDGEGPSLKIEEGSLIAFSESDAYLRIARGSRIEAEGTAAEPIVLSAPKDVLDDAATEEDRGLWGGVQINGNGITNKCADAEDCHVTAEGRPSTYGGNNNGESSGTLRYVQIRHAGYEVVDGDELNGLTLNAVGSGTTLEYVQTYTTQDDGFEMFGGAVDLKNIVAVNVGDDSIDYSEGYTGDIQYALVVHTGAGSNRCIEGDNTGSSSDDDLAPFTKLRISNMTCVTSNVAEENGSGKGDSEGPLFRRGAHFEMYNSIITSNFANMESNECVEVVSDHTYNNLNYSAALGNVVACSESLKTDVTGFDIEDWWDSAGNARVDAAGDLPAVVIDGLDSNPTAYVTADPLEDGNGNPIAVTVYDASQLEDSFDAAAEPAEGASGSSSFFEDPGHIGAVSSGNDWVKGWTTGL